MRQSGGSTQSLEQPRFEMPATTYGLHISQQVFQIDLVDASNGKAANRRFSRADLITFLSQRPAGRIALESCRGVSSPHR
jgi:transposase